MQARKHFYFTVSIVLLVAMLLSQGANGSVARAVTNARVPFTEHIIDGDFDWPLSVYAVDLDGDEDVDVLGAAANADDIAWWENDGEENFTKHTIADNFDEAHCVYAIDVDGDEDVDVLGAASDADDITWWENDGDESFTEHTIDGSFDGAYYVYAVDVDGDNDVDVLGAAWDADDVAWWENDGDENFTKHTVDSTFDGARSVYAIDLDGDDDMDILATADQADDITWWENDGDENFTEHTIDGNFSGADFVYAVDLDDDMDVDVLGTAWSADDIVWWENDGDENFSKHVIDGDFDSAKSVYATDMDGDGDVDVLGTATVDDDVAWWENDGSESFSKHIIAGDFDGAVSAYPTDVDGDGDVDVVGAAYAADDITWWEQGPPVMDTFVPLVLRGAGPPASPPALNDISNPGGDYNYAVSWGAVSGATSYTLEEDDNANFLSPSSVYDGSATSTTVYAGDVGTYYYHVKAANQFGESGWSNVESVVVTVPPPACPQTGSWSGDTSHSTAISFDVSVASGCQVESLFISYHANCTYGSVLRQEWLGSAPISNGHFSKSGVSGDFTSHTAASGSFSRSFYDPIAGSCYGSGTWTASYTP